MNNSIYANERDFDTSVNAGLRNFMLGVYNKLALGIALAGGLSYFVGATAMGAPVFQLVFGTPLLYAVMWGPLALILVSNFLIKGPTPFLSGLLYWSIVVLLGLSLSIWMYMATTGISGGSPAGRSFSPNFEIIAKAFFITASAFGGLSIFGYTTKRNLSGIGSFLIMAFWGLFVFGLVSAFFFPSGMLEVAIQLGILLVCAGLVATSTQELKESYFAYQGDETALAALSNHGALSFFLLFYNMFTILLSFMSQD